VGVGREMTNTLRGFAVCVLLISACESASMRSMTHVESIMAGVRSPHFAPHQHAPPVLKVHKPELRSKAPQPEDDREMEESVSEVSSSDELNIHLAAVERHLESIRNLVKVQGTDTVKRSNSWESALGKVRELPKLFDLNSQASIGQVKSANEANMCSECSSHSGSGRMVHQMGGTPDEVLCENICSAAFKGDLDALKRMITSKQQVNAADYFNRSALQLASAEGHVAIVEFLLAMGANVNACDKWGSSALMDAIRGDQPQIQDLLTKAGASPATETAPECEADSTVTPLLKRSRDERWGVDRADVKMGRVLGEGDQGLVFKAAWRGMPVVCKVLKDHEDAVKDLEFQNEIAVLSRLRHPNLVLFLGACLDWEPKFILTEYLPGGTLEDVFQRRKEENGGKTWKPSVRQVLHWATDLARALCFLHKQSPAVLHRDLKPGNLLLTEDNHVKLSDFGLSKCIEENNGDYKMTGETGTLRYMAPEVVRHEDYDEKVDVYSFGFVLWYMCTGELPLDGHTQEELLNAAAAKEDLRPDLTRIKFEPLRDLMRWCWTGDAKRRPTADDILMELDFMAPPCDADTAA